MCVVVCISKAGVACGFFGGGLIMLLMCVQQTETTDGFNACGRLMRARVFACDIKRSTLSGCVQDYSGRLPPTPLS